MLKHILLGSVPVTLLFLAYIGVDLGPFIFMAIIGGLFYLFIFNKKSSLSALGTGNQKKGHSLSNVKVKFEDIGGLQRVKNELIEALDFLIHQNEFEKYGIRPIKGILLDGPPGTGKTMLAKAAANYTDSVFIAASGSEFVEMYVGVGAQRVRSLFNEARTLANKNQKDSAIIFIDEIDVIGGKRDGRDQKEYDQTLNQLLTEMDGIRANDQPRILIMAATNRKDMLDPALIRPGRFDRHITVDLPDKTGRKKILEIHTANKPLADDVDIDKIATECFGFSGAQLESLVNEAAIYAYRENMSVIFAKHFSSAIDKVLLGEQIDKEATLAEKRRVAIHELGHALIAETVKPGSVSQVALRPRGKALGYVRHNPQEDRYLHTKSSIEDEIMVALGGTVAEEIFYGDRSTGAQNDFEKVLYLIEQMIHTGLTSLGIVNTNYVSKDKLAEENKKILEQLLEKTNEILTSYKEVIKQALNYLETEEVIDGNEFRKLINELTTNEKISQLS